SGASAGLPSVSIPSSGRAALTSAPTSSREAPMSSARRAAACRIPTPKRAVDPWSAAAEAPARQEGAVARGPRGPGVVAPAARGGARPTGWGEAGPGEERREATRSEAALSEAAQSDAELWVANRGQGAKSGEVRLASTGRRARETAPGASGGLPPLPSLAC